MQTNENRTRAIVQNEVPKLCRPDRVRDALINSKLRLHVVDGNLSLASFRRHNHARSFKRVARSVYSPLSQRRPGGFQETQDMSPTNQSLRPAEAAGRVETGSEIAGVLGSLPSVAELAPKPDGIESFWGKGRFPVIHPECLGVSIYDTCLLYTSRCV